jgi:hypothetical protein
VLEVAGNAPEVTARQQLVDWLVPGVHASPSPLAAKV